MLEQNGGGSVPFIEVILRTVSTFGSFLPFAHQKIIPNCTFAFMAYILKVIERRSLQKNGIRIIRCFLQIEFDEEELKFEEVSHKLTNKIWQHFWRSVKDKDPETQRDPIISIGAQ